MVTRHGKPVEQLTAVPQILVQFGFYKGRIKLLRGWDEALGENEFLGEPDSRCSRHPESRLRPRAGLRPNNDVDILPQQNKEAKQALD